MQRWSGRRGSNPIYVSGRYTYGSNTFPLPHLGPPRIRPVARPVGIESGLESFKRAVTF